MKKEIICPICKQNMYEPPHKGINNKDCPQCGQGINWKRAIKRKDKEMRKRFVKWLIKVLLPHHHLARNGPGRRKKIGPLNIDQQISNDYRTSHLGKFPGKNMGD